MHAGADLFAVANVTEAAQLRELGPGWPILVLSPLLPDEDRYAADYDLAATVSTPEELARLDAAGRAAGRPVAVHLKIDTGMGRLGVWHEQAPALAARILAAPHLRLAGVFTHFASPDDDPAFTERAAAPVSFGRSAPAGCRPPCRRGSSSTPTTARDWRPCRARAPSTPSGSASCSLASSPTRARSWPRSRPSRSSASAPGSGS